MLTASPITVRGEVYDATEVRVNGVLARMSGNTLALINPIYPSSAVSFINCLTMSDLIID